LTDVALARLYEATDYEVREGTAPFTIRVGERSPEADAMLDARGLEAWAFVTAENPGSVRLSDPENAARRAALEAEVAALGISSLRGRGVARDGSWREASLLLLGVDAGAAVALARRHGQRAIVAGARGEAARLLWCDDAEDVRAR